MSNIIKKLRKKSGLTQEQLARRCNLDQSDISRLENETIGISSRTANALAKVFNICPSMIMMYYTCLECEDRHKCNGDCFKEPTKT